MTTRTKIDRPITAPELAAIRSALERCPVAPEFPSLSAGLEGLQVIAGCGCGCDSVDFEAYDPERRSTPIADGIGFTQKGGKVGIIVWGRTDAVTALEIYDLGAGDDDLRVPVAESIRPF